MTDTLTSPPRSATSRRGLVGLAVSLGLVAVVAAVGGAVTSGAVPEWYDTLPLPTWAPPRWLFGPVWSALYLAMAVAAWLVWRRDGLAGARGPLALYGVQLALNLGWSLVFFGLRAPLLGLLEILLLDIAVAATLVAFGRRDRVAGLLLAPYLAWALFATALNAAIVLGG